MKLENRHLAQARRARERQKQVRVRKIKQGILVLIGILAAGFLIYAVVSSFGNSDTTSDSTAETIVETEATSEDSTTATEEASTSLNTDPSLTVADGDVVNIDYVGTIDGVEFNGGNTNGAGADLTIGSGAYIEGFEDQIVGHQVGETFDITVTFPDNYGETTTVDGNTVTLDNREVVFTITVNGIYQ